MKYGSGDSLYAIVSSRGYAWSCLLCSQEMALLNSLEPHPPLPAALWRIQAVTVLPITSSPISCSGLAGGADCVL